MDRYVRISIDPPRLPRRFDRSDPLLSERLIPRVAQLPGIARRGVWARRAGRFDVEPVVCWREARCGDGGEEGGYLGGDWFAGYAVCCAGAYLGALEGGWGGGG